MQGGASTHHLTRPPPTTLAREVDQGLNSLSAPAFPRQRARRRPNEERQPGHHFPQGRAELSPAAAAEAAETRALQTEVGERQQRDVGPPTLRPEGHPLEAAATSLRRGACLPRIRWRTGYRAGAGSRDLPRSGLQGEADERPKSPMRLPEATKSACSPHERCVRRILEGSGSGVLLASAKRRRSAHAGSPVGGVPLAQGRPLGFAFSPGGSSVRLGGFRSASVKIVTSLA